MGREVTSLATPWAQKVNGLLKSILESVEVINGEYHLTGTTPDCINKPKVSAWLKDRGFKERDIDFTLQRLDKEPK